MALKDENKTQFIQDPSLMEIFLKRPGGTDFEVISQATQAADIQYTAGDEKNPFRLDYHPKNLADGVYELRVQGKDVAGNLSGKEMYKINFEVINASTITRFHPYPNPFSSNTRFIFTLTGGSIPERMKIQVLTVTGKVVREITQEEIGPIRIGNNITQFAWDGTDEFGDKLANGVYLYRVVMDRQPEEFKHRRTAGDRAFKQEYGKLYILR
jgi:flagellar hook assembly protein FlgD